ncbi:hypothetical protein K3555_13185 [Leisingera sp. M527]|uniref:hypothetical protein n=1 Tax=unclassified Leisingera TaxID=2614906 RepID=UPI0021A44061|nr:MULTISPECIES: hypothetical protein [unclassified Leisingera]UWQ27488.1 hypothetical protein K3557_11750 [Leisingera sp. M523]UWQ31549.1 hypothetical protein K3555_13185 [Leisingera sp. M527]UWQ73541.1 hypothetical protein K3724_13375 [Leisingera sp. M658]
MRNFEIGSQEAGANNKADERANERAALEAVINYAIQCARETDILGAGEALEEARLNLSRAVLA